VRYTASTTLPCGTQPSTVLGMTHGVRWGIVAIFCGNLAAGEASAINGTGESTRDYVCAGDVSCANVLALEGEVPSGRIKHRNRARDQLE
jgi:hypothetical protein